MEETIIHIENLSKKYKMYQKKRDIFAEALFPWLNRHHYFTAVDQVSLDIKKGESVGIMGCNGAGKSTLLKMITGVVRPSEGVLETKGMISSLLELGTAFNPELTGLQNIYQHGQVFGLTNEQIHARESEIIEFASIGEHLYQPVKTYSSGMFARLAFACAINVDPDILIVDEVLSVGDMAFQLKCFKKFEQFKEAGKTILFVTHSITDVLRNCTRSIIISSGKKIFDGGVKEGVEKYKKIIVGLDDGSQEEKPKGEKGIKKSENTWRSALNENPEVITYGNGDAEVVDYGVFDSEGNLVPTIENDKEVVLKSKVVFNKDINDPIFTMTLKDFRGLSISGTNTLIEKISTGLYKKGTVATVTFRQIFNVAAGKYTLSFSCTHFDKRGELEVLDRKYDALLIEIISSKETVGLLKIDSDISIEKETAGENEKN